MIYNENLINLEEFTEEENAYRRGYSHGFLASRNSPELTVEEVYEWREGDKKTAPPGSCFAGKELHGLTKAEQHRFFINKLKS